MERGQDGRNKWQEGRTIRHCKNERRARATRNEERARGNEEGVTMNDKKEQLARRKEGQ